MYKFVNVDAAASPRFHNTVKAVFLLWLLGIFTESSTAIDRGCDYRQRLESSVTYFVYNGQYPNADIGARSCRWTAESNYRIRLSCFEVDLPCSRNCTRDSLTISLGNGIVRKHCGTKWFIEESVGKTMVIDFTSSPLSPGSKFLCQLQALDPEDDDCRCGWKNPTRIVGGIETGINEYPMMAGLVDTSNRVLYCGGTIISHQHILTAAHCLANINPYTLGIVVGEHDVQTGAETNATRLYRVLKVDIHPKYIPDSSAYDLAIVRVDGIINFGNQVGPACLPFLHAQDTFAGSVVTVLGWGTTEFGGPKSNVLQKANVYVISNMQCRSYDEYSSITNRELCTYRYGKDACQFDSGGGVLFEDKSTSSVAVVGVISRGIDCAGPAPALNTRPDIPWILRVTETVKFCMKE